MAFGEDWSNRAVMASDFRNSSGQRPPSWILVIMHFLFDSWHSLADSNKWISFFQNYMNEKNSSEVSNHIRTKSQIRKSRAWQNSCVKGHSLSLQGFCANASTSLTVTGNCRSVSRSAAMTSSASVLHHWTFNVSQFIYILACCVSARCMQ